ncbi:hypothetical protein D3C73_1349420 [compost metagenome]
MSAPEIGGEAGRRLYGKRGPADNQQISRRKSLYGVCQHPAVQLLLIQHDIRLDDAAADRTMRNRLRTLKYRFQTVRPRAFHAVIPVYGTVNLQHAGASGLLVQTVDVLRHYGA